MRLVIQGSALTYSHLAHIHQLCATSVQFVQMALHAYYLANQTTPLPAVQQFCAEQNIDCAYVQDLNTYEIWFMRNGYGFDADYDRVY